MGNVRIAIVAGEASGDALGSHLVKALRERLPQAEFFGVAGPKMLAVGVRTQFPMEKLSLIGFNEVIRNLFSLLKLRRELKRQLLSFQPHVYIGVDAPDFNFHVERFLRKRGVATVHFASPSIWAWRGKRIHKIKRAVDHMLVLLPFEKAIYDQAGIPATYVGHPMADSIPLEDQRALAREQLKLNPSSQIVAMLPGSRCSELQLHADLFVQTAQRLHALLPELRFLVPLSTKATRRMFEEAMFRQQAGELPLTILFGHAQQAMAAADCVLVKSGTATLEAALLKRPMVITYRIPKTTYFLVKRRFYLPYFGLPNVLAGRFVVPELMQEQATPENLAQAVKTWLEDKEARAKLRAEFQDLHVSLRQNTAQRATDAILGLLQARGAC